MKAVKFIKKVRPYPLGNWAYLDEKKADDLIASGHCLEFDVKAGKVKEDKKDVKKPVNS